MARLLEYEPAAHRLPAACDAYERGVSLAGMSKAYALPGIRVGWLATRSAEILDKVARLKTYTTICGGTADELLARIALKNGPAIIARNLGILRANLALAEAFFAAHADRFEFVRPRVGTVVFPRLARDGDDADAYCAALAREHALILVPPSAMAPADVAAALEERLGPRFRLGIGRTTLPGLLTRWGVAVAAEGVEAAATVEARL